MSDVDSTGASTSAADVSLDDLLGEPYWINVHKPYEEIDTHVACGNTITGPAIADTPAPGDSAVESSVGDEARLEEWTTW